MKRTLPNGTAHATDNAATSIDWTAGVSGTWSNASNWSGGLAPDASDSVTIAASGSYTVSIDSPGAAASLLIDAASAIVDDISTLTLTGSLSLAAGTLVLGKGGKIHGGTLTTGAQGDLICAGGTLAGVTYQGNLNLSADSSHLVLYPRDIFSGANGQGSADIDITGAGAELTTIAHDVIDNVYIDLGSNVGTSTISVIGSVSSLTLGPDAVINQVGKHAEIFLYNGPGSSNATLVNEGTITAGLSGGTLDIENFGFTPYTFAGDTLTNLGGLVATNGGTLLLETNLSAGSLHNFSTSSGGVLELLRGTLANAGTNVSLSTGRQLTLVGGAINGGTITNAGGGLISEMGTLNGVTCLGDFDLTDGQSIVLNGNTNGTGTSPTASVFNETGSNTSPSFDSGIIAVGGTTLNDAIINLGEYGVFSCRQSNAPTVTLGVGLNILGTGPGASIDLDAYSQSGTNYSLVLLNQGTIAATATGDNLTIDGFNSSTAVSGMFVNQGSLVATNGGTLVLDTILAVDSLAHFSTRAGGVVNLEGTLQNTGTTLALGAGRHLTLNGVVEGGTIVDSGNGLIAGEQAVLDDVTYVGTLNVDVARTNLVVNGGFTDANGVINVAGEKASIYFEDTATLNNLTVNLGSAGGDYFAAALGADSADVSTMTLGSQLTINQSGANVEVYLSAPDNASNSCTVVNQGIITADIEKGILSIVSSTADADGSYITFINAGSISIATGGSVAIGQGVDFINSGHILINDGTLKSIGLSNNGTIDVAGGTVSATSLSGLGTSQIGATGTLILSLSVDSGQCLDFTADAGLLDLGTPSQFLGTIAGFGGSAEIDLLHIQDTSFNFSDGVLTVKEGSKTVASLNFAGNYQTADFTLTPDGHHGTTITFT